MDLVMNLRRHKRWKFLDPTFNARFLKTYCAA